jgi:P-type conjugative transfer protein TrbJ
VRKIVAVAAGVAVCALLHAPQARAQAVTCLNCSTLVEQAVMAGKQIEQLAQEIQVAENTLNTFMYAVQNTVNLPFTAFNDITGTVNQIASIGQRSQMLIDQTKMMIDNLGTGAGYPVGTIADLQNQLAAEQIAVSNAMRQAGLALNTLSGQLPANSANFAALHAQALGTSGRQQSLQTLAGIAASQGQVQTQAQTTGVAVQQALLTTQAAMIDRAAANDALNKSDLANALAADCAALAATGGSFWGCSGGSATGTTAPAQTVSVPTVTTATPTLTVAATP